MQPINYLIWIPRWSLFIQICVHFTEVMHIITTLGKLSIISYKSNTDYEITTLIIEIIHCVPKNVTTVWVKKIPPYGFLKFFPKRFGIFNQCFTHLLYNHFYTRVQTFIQIRPTLTKLCHTKRDHLAKFYISLEL